MKFLLKEFQKNQNFSLVYRSEDYSFDIEPFDENGDTSIMINDLQLEIDHEGKIIYVWGYCPLINYQKTEKYPQEYQSHSLIAILNDKPCPGVSYRLNEKNRWPIYINIDKGWVCIGDPELEGEQKIEFVSNCVAVLNKHEIVTIWLKPKNFPNLENL